MIPIPRPLLFAAATFALATFAACSNETAIPIPPGDGYVAGGGPTVQSPSSTQDAGTTSSPSYVDSGSPSSTSSADSGSGSSIDAGYSPTPEAAAPQPDAGSPAQPAKGPLGSCTNPVCGTDLNECGCQATDSNGDTVQMGCQAGGQCICLVNNNQTDNPFDENGACGAQATTVEQFLTNCTCQ